MPMLNRDALAWVNPLDITPGGALNHITLLAAITSIGSASRGMILNTGTWVIGANVTIPPNIHLIRGAGTILSVSSTFTLTINGSEEGPLMQWLAGLGSVVLGAKIPESYPQWFGALCDGTTDDISAFNKLFLAHAHPVVLQGTCLVGSSINAQSNQHITIRQGATLKAKTGAWPVDTGILNVSGKTNVTIDGVGTLDGNKAGNPTGRTFGVFIYESSDVRVQGITIQNMPGSNAAGTLSGDGIYVGGSSGPSTGILVAHCIIVGNVRQGISVTYADGVRIISNDIHGTTGNNPGAGVDIEPDASNTVSNVVIGFNTFADNHLHVQVAKGSVSSDRPILVIGNIMNTHRTTTGGAIYATRSVKAMNNLITFTNGYGILLEAGRGSVVSGNTITGNYTATEQEGIRARDNLTAIISNNTIRFTRGVGLRVGRGSSDAFLTYSPQAVIITNNILEDCVDPSITGVGAITISSGFGNLYFRIQCRSNLVYDSRTGGNECDVGIQISNMTDAEWATCDFADNLVDGPTTKFSAGAGRVMSMASHAASATLDFNLTSVTFHDLTIAVPGAVLGDAVALGVPFAAIIGDISYSAFVSATDVVTVRAKASGNPNPVSGLFKVIVNKI